MQNVDRVIPIRSKVCAICGQKTVDILCKTCEEKEIVWHEVRDGLLWPYSRETA